MDALNFIQHGPEKPKPILESHLGQFYLKRLEANANNVVLVTEVDDVEITLTCGEILRRGKVVSVILKEHGLKSGDTVMILCGNTFDFLPVMLGAFFTGIAVSPINPEAGTSDFSHFLSIIKPGLVLCDTESHSSMLVTVAQCDIKPDVMTLADLANQYTRPESDSFMPCEITDLANHVAVIMTSSGTTGRPKGVEISQATLLTMLQGLTMLPSTMVGLNLSGPYWASGIIAQMMFSSVGAKLVLLTKFTEKALLDAISKYKVNFTSLGPDKFTALAKWPDTDKYDVSSLIWLACGGARLSQAMQDLAEKRLKKPITNGYGMTESFVVFETPMGGLRKSASVGKAAANCSAKIVDVESGVPLGPNCEGEVCFKTPFMLLRYRGNPEATKALFDEDGFIRSGDIGYYDTDGYFFIIDRIKDLIKFKNIQVPAQDIEEVLLRHESVQDVAVVGIPDDDDGEHSTAFIIKKNNATVTAEELTRLVEGELPRVKWLHGGVVFVESFPRTASDKVKKRDLRTMHVASLTSTAAKSDKMMEANAKNIIPDKNTLNKLEDAVSNNESDFQEPNVMHLDEGLRYPPNEEKKIEVVKAILDDEALITSAVSEAKVAPVISVPDVKVDAVSAVSETKVAPIISVSETKLTPVSAVSEVKKDAVSAVSETKVAPIISVSETKLTPVSAVCDIKVDAVSEVSVSKVLPVSGESTSQVPVEVKVESISDVLQAITPSLDPALPSVVKLAGPQLDPGLLREANQANAVLETIVEPSPVKTEAKIQDDKQSTQNGKQKKQKKSCILL